LAFVSVYFAVVVAANTALKWRLTEWLRTTSTEYADAVPHYFRFRLDGVSVLGVK
jgi:hypothetical protein